MLTEGFVDEWKWGKSEIICSCLGVVIAEPDGSSACSFAVLHGPLQRGGWKGLLAAIEKDKASGMAAHDQLTAPDVFPKTQLNLLAVDRASSYRSAWLTGSAV